MNGVASNEFRYFVSIGCFVCSSVCKSSTDALAGDEKISYRGPEYGRTRGTSRRTLIRF